MLTLGAVQRLKGAALQRSGVATAYYTVMSFGDGSQGALGQDQRAGSVAIDAYEPAPIEALPHNIIRVAAGHYHSLALSSDGHLWSWGRNNEGQLGRGTALSRQNCKNKPKNVRMCTRTKGTYHTVWTQLWRGPFLLSTRLSNGEESNYPQVVNGLKGVKVKDMVGSGVISMAIDVHGSLWAWGKSKRGQLGLGEGITEAVFPQLVQSLSGQQILQVSLGWGHALACTTDGSLYSWGYFVDGRLGYPLEGIDSHGLQNATTTHLVEKEGGLSEDMKMEMNMIYQWEPRLVPLDDLKAICVSCGFDHSLVVCENNILLSFGDNTYGQLGRTSRAVKPPKEWEVPLQGHVVSASSGLGHSLAVCDVDRQSRNDKMNLKSAGHVYSWGWNSAFQLGRTSCNEKPMKIEGLKERHVVSMDGGRVHSVAVDDEGGLWTWGSGKNGRLGLGSFGDEQEPCLVDSIQEELKVQQAVCGMDHTIILGSVM